eukprot:3772951-Rhodomonas_salina.1
MPDQASGWCSKQTVIEFRSELPARITDKTARNRSSQSQRAVAKREGRKEWRDGDGTGWRGAKEEAR